MGRNDLSSKSAKEMVKSIAALGDAIKTEDSKIDLTFSEIVLRNGKKAFVDKVNFVSLDKLCTLRNWGLINHKNIKKYQYSFNWVRTAFKSTRLGRISYKHKGPLIS